MESFWQSAFAPREAMAAGSRAYHSLGLRATSRLKDRFIHAQQTLYQMCAEPAALPELRTNYAARPKSVAITGAVRPLYF
jgi:hypothetical protein